MREQVDDLQQGRLQPTAQPVDTYVRPADPATDLVRSLAGFSQTLDQHVQLQANRERVAQEAAAEAKIGGMTHQESEAYIKSGELHRTQSPWFRAAFEKQYGIRLGNEARRQASEELASADISQVDPEAFAANVVKQNAEQVQGSVFMQAGFAASTKDLAQEVRDKVNEQRIKETVEQRNDNAYQNFFSWAQNYVKGPFDAETAKTALRAQMQANRDTLGMSYKDQDQTLLQVMHGLAQVPGSKPLLMAMGTLDRDNGVTLATKAGPKFQALLDTAQATTDKDDLESIQGDISEHTMAADSGSLNEDDWNEFADTHSNVISGSQKAAMLIRNRNAQEEAQRRALALLHDNAKEAVLSNLSTQVSDLARQGHIAEAQDVDVDFYGKRVHIPADEVRKFGLGQSAAQIEKEMVAQGQPPQAIRENIVRMYASNGEVDPLVQSRVQTVLNASAAPGDVPQSVLDYLPEVAMLHDVAPGMLNQVAKSDQDQKFLGAVAVGIDVGLNPQEAIRNAIWRRDNADRIGLPNSAAMNQYTQDISKGLNSRIPFVGPHIEDYATLNRVIQERVNFWAASGASGKDLEKRVTESIQRTHMYLNGHLVDITGTGMNGVQAQPIFQDAANAIKAAKPAYAKDDISFLPMAHGSSNFMAVTSTGIPIPGTVRTWEEMSKQYNATRQKRLLERAGDRAARERAADTVARGQAPIIVGGQLQ